MVSDAEVKLSKSDFDRLSKVVYAHCGINLSDGKHTLVEARLAKLVRRQGYDSTESYLAKVLADPQGDAFVNLIDILSTNLTSFFREDDHFDYLTSHVVPQILERKAAKKRIRVWCAACSTGEEAYTLGMVLSEAIPNIETWDVKILATDISTRVLETANRAVYSTQRMAGIPPQLKTRYFSTNRLDGQTFHEPVPALRRLISFRHLNLVEPWPFTGPFDFIFCRNVMIYFDKPTQERLVNRFHGVLESGGMLFTGHSESLTGVKHPFEYVRATIYRKR